MHRVLARAAALFCIIFVAGGCQYSPDSAERTLAFNRSVEQATNQQFLLNAVRSSKREPTYYARLASNLTTSSINPSFSISLPVHDYTSFLPSISITETNQLSLANLDDQSFIEGIMAPVPLQAYAYFHSEGFLPEQLLLLFMGGVELPSEGLQTLRHAVELDCALNKFSAQSAECDLVGDRFSALLDESCKTRPPSEKMKDGCNSSWQISQFEAASTAYLTYKQAQCDSPSKDGEKCTPTGNDFRKWVCRSYLKVDCSHMDIWDAAVVDKSCNGEAGEKLKFANDPAIYRQDSASREFRSFRCFQLVERAMLELGFHPAQTTSHKIVFELPLNVVKGNPRLLSDMTQQGYEVATNLKIGRVGICKKSSDYDVELGKVSTLKPATARKSSDPEPVFNSQSKYTADLFVETKTSDAGEAKSGTTDKAKAPDSCNDALSQKLAQKADKSASNGDNEAKNIVFSQRSLEAMVYYLGQIIRRKYELGSDDKVTFLNVAATKPYEEELFRVRKNDSSRDAIVSVDSHGDTFSIPPLCESPDCTTQFPEHASPQILTILTQVLGMQKATTALPAPTAVTVISSH